MSHPDIWKNWEAREKSISSESKSRAWFCSTWKSTDRCDDREDAGYDRYLQSYRANLLWQREYLSGGIKQTILDRYLIRHCNSTEMCTRKSLDLLWISRKRNLLGRNVTALWEMILGPIIPVRICAAIAMPIMTKRPWWGISSFMIQSLHFSLVAASLETRCIRLSRRAL